MNPRARVQLSPSLRALRAPSAGLLAQRQAAQSLISLAGLVGRPVVNPDGSEVGRVLDVVARWQGEPYPSLTGLVAKVGRRRTFVPASALAELTTPLARLSSARLDLVDFVRRDGEVLLAQDVLDHQLVDVDGVQVIRAADLYLARVGIDHRLVGVDVGVRSLVRRLGPRRWRAHATPDRVIDWSVIQPLGGGGGAVHLTRSSRELHRLRPAEIADLLDLIDAIAPNPRHSRLPA